jgi:DNA modification methylase
VLDSFCGSGTILIAGEKIGRRVRTIELDPRYVDVAIRRWEQYSGKPARLAPMGEMLDEISEARLGSAAAA